MTDADKLQKTFNDLGLRDRSVPDGYNFIATRALTEGDILIWSDPNHRASYDNRCLRDIFSPEKLARLKGLGVADIYTENPAFEQPLFEALQDSVVAGKPLPKERFVGKILELSLSKMVDAQTYRKNVEDLYDMIVNAAPEIRVHAAQIDDTAEQKAQLESLSRRETEVSDRLLSQLSDFTPALAGYHSAPSDETTSYAYIDFLYSDLPTRLRNEPFMTPDEFSATLRKMLPSEERRAAFDKLAPDKIPKLYEEFSHYRTSLQDLASERRVMENRFRIENDGLLADYIAGTARGKSVLMHGLHHGAHVDDLDEHLARLGLTSTRAAFYYKPQDLEREKAKISLLPDIPEISYWPATDTMRIEDFNPPAPGVVGEASLGQINGVQKNLPKADSVNP
jgi:hypothetical protein